MQGTTLCSTVALMNFLQAIRDHEQGPWAVLKYPERSASRARRVFETLKEMGHPMEDHMDLDFFGEVQLLSLQERWSIQNSSMNRYIAVLDSMGFHVKYFRVPKDPRVRCLSCAELAKLDARVRKQSTRWDAYKAVYAILRDTGCRGLAELTRAGVGDAVDWENRTYTLTSFKGSRDCEGTSRVVPLTDLAQRALAWIYHEDAMIFESQWRTFWELVRLDKSNVPYDLRHTFCTRLLDSNVPPPTVMQIMGHSTLDQTLHYMHQRPSALKAARAALQLE